MSLHQMIPDRMLIAEWSKIMNLSYKFTFTLKMTMQSLKECGERDN